MSKKLTYDAAFAELSKILNDLQSEETGLDQLSDMLKRAGELTEFCKTKLRTIEADIEKVNQSEH
jgi:exodeoxyribonuclease VII small subunit